MVEIEKEMFARKVIPNFAGREVLFNDGVEIFVNIQNFFPWHSGAYFIIKHNCQISFGVLNDSIDFKLGRIVVDR